VSKRPPKTVRAVSSRTKRSTDPNGSPAADDGGQGPSDAVKSAGVSPSQRLRWQVATALLCYWLAILIYLVWISQR